MTAFQKRLGLRLGVKPGSEMFEAANVAKSLTLNLCWQTGM